MAQNFRISPIVIKLAVVALIIKELWLLLGIPSFTDAVMSFLTVGAIPGTDRTLTPDEMYKLLAAVGILTIVLVFRKELTRLFWRKHENILPNEPLVAVPAPPKAVAVKKVKAPAMPLPHPAPHFVTPSFIVRLQKSPRLARYTASLRAKAFAAKQKSLEYWRQGKDMTIAAGQRAWAWTKLGSLVAYRLLLLTIIIIVNAVVAFWKWAEPRIRTFDAYLEKKIHSNEYTSGVARAIAEVADAAKKAFEGVKAIAKELTKPREN